MSGVAMSSGSGPMLVLSSFKELCLFLIWNYYIHDT